MDTMDWISLIIVALIAIQLLKWLTEWYTNYKKLSHVNGINQIMYFPYRLPLLSPTYNLQDWRLVSQLMKSHGDPKTRSLRISMLYYNTLIINDKEMLKELFTSKQSYFEKPAFEYDMLGVFGDNIISASSTEIWKKHHAACNQAFNDENLKLVCQQSNEAVDLLFKTKWNFLERDQEGCFIIDPYTDFSNVTLEVLGRAGYGMSFGIFDQDSEGKEFAKSMNHVIDIGLIVRRYILLNFPFIFPITCKLLGLDKSVGKVKQVLTNCIEKRRSEINEMGEDFPNKDILSLLVKANMQENLLTNDELVSNTFILSAAGFHTSSTSLQWIIYELSRNLQIQSKARSEIYTILGKHTNPTLEDYEKFQYLNAVIFESLRLHPPVTSVMKQVCKKETTLSNITIPKGTNIEIFIASTHIDDRYWTNPLQYNPERFLNMETGQFERRSDFSFIPFSRGMRKCIGFRFAEREICMILIRLLQQYEFYSLTNEHLIKGWNINNGYRIWQSFKLVNIRNSDEF